MSSSITTAIPTDLIEDWCITRVELFDGTRYECADGKPEWQASDFQTFCCNGQILNTAWDIWRGVVKGGNNSVALSDMICCGNSGPEQGGVLPLPTAYTTCSEGSPTPLASVAGTNTDNAVPFLVTYTSASFGAGTVVGDYIPTETPTCFWAYTKGLGTTEITLPAPDITTLPPAETDIWGFTTNTPKPTTTTRPISTTGSASEVTGTSTPSSASAVAGMRKGYMYLGLGFMTTILLWS
ncbi:uncharacterized protein F4812DRAFT_461760 [Daldinia caldariorum]|uniref:uncharacterized protein n=1 Tax=Daldinia caldariorum TaxID=326644 RepID=UPI0020084630|nr:uncharacterized protein F4812DRAFT_461760 [Daldinia caldariorum]KAI1465450.1 hypothetical protein F4812DRAFT_461760 [Daldinia caldariorum]